MNKLSSFVIVIAVAAIGAGTWLWWRDRQPEPQVQSLAVEQTEPAPADELPASAPDPTPEIRYPIESLAATEPPADSDDAGVLMTRLLGRDAVLKFLQLADFPRRVVATVDSLGRGHAAPALWLVSTTPGRFAVRGEAETLEVDPANTRRYDAFVAMVQSVDVDRAMAVYLRLYPSFQDAYQELGYPRGYFNDRLVAVIDGLLATPEVDGPIPLVLTPIKDESKAARPWVRYQFANPDLESLSAGQKILIRVGPAHRKVLKAKLQELRKRVAGGPPPSSPRPAG